MAMSPTRDDLARMYPRAVPGWIDALAELSPKLCAHYGIDRLEWCHMAGQIAAETDGLTLRPMQEDMRYSARRMVEVFGYRLNAAVKSGPVFGRTFRNRADLATFLAGKPDMLADVVYGGPDGREGTPPWQGSRYLGRGPLQTTHLNNYRAARDEIRRQPGGKSAPDIVDRPDLLATDPAIGVRALFAEWHLKGLRRWALADDCDTLSDVLNTGNARDSVKPHGLPRRRRETARAKGIWPDGVQDRQNSPVAAAVSAIREGSHGPDVLAAQELLVARGYPLGAADGSFGPLMRRAVVAFQSEHGLPVDGDLDAADMEVLRATAPIELTRSAATTVPGSDQIVAGSAIKTTGEVATMAAVTEAAGNAAGVSPVSIAMGYLGQAGEMVGKITGMGMTLPPKIVALVVASIAGLTLWKWGGALIERRIAKYRSGLDLSR